MRPSPVQHHQPEVTLFSRPLASLCVFGLSLARVSGSETWESVSARSVAVFAIFRSWPHKMILSWNRLRRTPPRSCSLPSRVDCSGKKFRISWMILCLKHKVMVARRRRRLAREKRRAGWRCPRLALYRCSGSRVIWTVLLSMIMNKVMPATTAMSPVLRSTDTLTTTTAEPTATPSPLSGSKNQK